METQMIKQTSRNPRELSTALTQPETTRGSRAVHPTWARLHHPSSILTEHTNEQPSREREGGREISLQKPLSPLPLLLHPPHTNPYDAAVYSHNRTPPLLPLKPQPRPPPLESNHLLPPRLHPLHHPQTPPPNPLFPALVRTPQVPRLGLLLGGSYRGGSGQRRRRAGGGRGERRRGVRRGGGGVRRRRGVRRGGRGRGRERDRGTGALVGAQVHMDGEEHSSGAGPRDPRLRDGAAEPVLLLAEEGRLGGAQDGAGEQAVDLAKEDDHTP